MAVGGGIVGNGTVVEKPLVAERIIALALYVLTTKAKVEPLGRASARRGEGLPDQKHRPSSVARRWSMLP